MMYGAERQQIRHDFSTAPELVRRYLPEEAHEDAVTMVRQVNGVTTYLSQMATGETRHHEAVVFAAAVAAIDTVTDIRKEEVAEPTGMALRGGYVYPEMELVDIASSHARGEGFDVAIKEIAKWQDLSLKQFGDLEVGELKDITRHKGGSSAQAHLFSMKAGVSAEEDRLMMQFGYLMQLLDDYLDKPEDEREGVSTLFTEGVYDRNDLLVKIDEVERAVAGVWGETAASRRFFNICRWHTRLGWVANHTPFDPEKHVPYYF